MDWTCIVTTAPRSICTLKLTCESLADCGWTPIIFAEPGSTDLSDQFQTFWNSERLGVWGNLSQAMRWALDQKTPRIITVQDDVDFHPETKDWLDRIVWPSNTGFISPYTPRPYQTWKAGNPRPIGLNAVSMRSCWTGQSLAFERHVLEAISCHSRWLNWSGLPPPKLKSRADKELYRKQQRENPVNIKNVDFIIGSIIQKDFGLKLYYPNPSLATHCNPVSSINHGPNTGRRNALFVADFTMPIEGQLSCQ